MYMLFMSILFLVLSAHEKYRFEWRVLSGLLFMTWINICVYSSTDPELYFIRAVLTIVAALLLLSVKSKFGLIQSIILLLTLIAYGMLAYDVSQRAHILIYNYYEAVIYGLVICQLISIYPTIRAGYIYFSANNSTNLEHNKVAIK